MDNLNNDNGATKELLHSLQVLKRAKTEYEKSDMELEVFMWNHLDEDFQELFSKYNEHYFVMKNFLREIEQNDLNDFFDSISPIKNSEYIKKFVTYKEMTYELPDKSDYLENEKKSKI